MPKKKLTLKDIDSKELNATLEKHSAIPDTVTPAKEASLICPLCHSPLKKVMPEIRMDGLTLYECVQCKERRYLEEPE